MLSKRLILPVFLVLALVAFAVARPKQAKRQARYYDHHRHHHSHHLSYRPPPQEISNEESDNEQPCCDQGPLLVQEYILYKGNRPSRPKPRPRPTTDAATTLAG